MKEQLITLLPTNWSPELSTFLLSMVPVGELRFAIPWAVKFTHLSPEEAFVIAVMGNTLIGLLVFLLISPFTNYLECRGKYLGKLICWLRERARKKGSESFTKWGSWGLFFLVAIPFPGTGAWTGAMVAAFLGIKTKNAIPAIIAGVVVAGIVILAGTKGVVSIF